MAKGKKFPPVETHPDGEDPTFAVSNVAGISGKRLLSFIERIERLEEEIKGTRADIKEVKAEAKGSGFDLKVITYLIKLRKQDADARDEFDTLVDTYKRAIKMDL